MTRTGVKFAKEALTIKCEELVTQVAEMLGWDMFEETSGNLTQGERDCLEQLIPQIRIAAELFRQCSKNKEAGDDKQE